jgi:hypothetical protein
MNNRKSRNWIDNSTQLDSSCLLPVGEFVRNLMKTPDVGCEMQRIDKPRRCSMRWNAYPAGYPPCRRKGSMDNASRITSFTSSRLSSLSLGDDEASAEFRPKIASLQNCVTLEYETAFSCSTVTSSWWTAFLERLLSPRKKNDTPLLHLVFSDDLKYRGSIFDSFFNVFFQGFVL